MIRSVSKVSGTSGWRRSAVPTAAAPMSPTVRTSRPSAIESAVSTTIATSGDGTARVRRGKQVDDRQAGRDHRVDRPAAAHELRQLGHEDQDGERVDEADHHRARDEPHQPPEPQQAGDDLEHARQDGGGEEILRGRAPAPACPSARPSRRWRPRSCRPAAGEGDDDGDRERGVEADLGSTPATTEKPIASGMSARATTRPARTSARGLASQSRRRGARTDMGYSGTVHPPRRRHDRGCRLPRG